MRWIAKAMVQKMLSQVPGGKHLNYGLQIAAGAHSQSTADSRVPGLITFLSKIDEIKPIRESVVLEISTGWNAINAVVLSLLGAKEVVATDYTRHLRLAHMKKVVQAAKKESQRIAAIARTDQESVIDSANQLLDAQTQEAFLKAARITYLAPANACDLEFPDGTFDIVYSCRVLAHFPEEQLSHLARETRRLLKPGGVVAHIIGLQDPYYRLRGGSRVGFLTYSNRVWKIFNSEMQSNNRVRASQHIKRYTELGAKILLMDAKFKADDVERLKKMKVAPQFTGLSLEDMATHSCDVIMQF